MEDILNPRMRRSFNPVLVFESLTEYQETDILEDTMCPEWNQDIVLKLKPGTTDPVELLDWIEQEKYRVSLCDFRDDGTTSWREVVATGVLELSTVLYNCTPGVALPYVLPLTRTTANMQRPDDTSGPNLHVELMIQPPACFVSFYHQTVCLPREELFLRVEKIQKELCRGLKRKPTSVHKATYVMNPRRDALFERDETKDGDSTTVVSLSNSKFLRASKHLSDKGGFTRDTPTTESNNGMELSSWFEYPNILYPIWQNAVNRYSKAFPTRPIGTIAKDEYGTFNFLPAFVNVVTGCGETSAQAIADKVAKLECTNSGSLGLGYRLWSIVLNSPTLTLRLGRGNLLELAVILCSFFLGIRLDAYVCVGAREGSTLNAWVVVQEDATATEEGSHTNRGRNIQHWDVCKGKCIVDQQGLLAHGFKQVYFIFNHRNLWANVQSRSGTHQVRWHLDQQEDWEALLPDSVLGPHGPIECCYSAPVFALGCLQHNDDLETKLLASDVASALEKYRTHRLFLPFTEINDKMSRRLNQLLESGKRVPRTVHHDGIGWNVSTFLFHTLALDTIMHRLEMLGVLNNSGVNVEYAVGAYVRTHVWGIRDVYVSVATSIMPQDIGSDTC